MNKDGATLTLRIGAISDLARYLARQADHLFPSSDLNGDIARFERLLPRVLARMRPILAAVRNFVPGQFDHLNSLQHASVIYLLANEIFLAEGECELADRLFCVNRALHSIDLFYKVRMPEIFFLSHALGSVLGNTTYGNHLVVFHNVTVGRVGDARPVIGNRVVLYAGATVTGGAVIGNNCVISAGVVVNKLTVPDNTMVRIEEGKLVLKPMTRDMAGLYFRLSDVNSA